MKKSSILSVIMIMVIVIGCVFMMSGCQGGLPDYYNTTYVMTGKAYALDWDAKNQYDNGPKQMSANGEYFSYRELLTAYYDDIAWGANKPATVDEAIEKIDEAFEKYFENQAGTSFSISSKDDLTLTVKFASDMEREDFVIKMAETKEQFDALYPNIESTLTSPTGGSCEMPNFREELIGRNCYGAFEYTYQGQTYNWIIDFSVSSAYGLDHETLGDLLAIHCTLPFEIPNYEADGNPSHYFETISQWAYLYDGQGNSIISFSAVPEIYVEVEEVK